MFYLNSSGHLNLKGKIALIINIIILLVLLIMLTLDLCFIFFDINTFNFLVIFKIVLKGLFYFASFLWGIFYLSYLFWAGNIFNVYAEKIVGWSFSEFINTYNKNPDPWQISGITDPNNICDSIPRIRYSYSKSAPISFRLIFNFIDYLKFLVWVTHLNAQQQKTKRQEENFKYIKMIKENEKENNV